MNFKAIGNNVIIKAEREKQSSGIVLIDTGTYEEKKNWFREKLTVVSVGETVTNVTEGERVYAVNKGTRFEEMEKTLEVDENTAYFICKAEDIPVVS